MPRTQSWPFKTHITPDDPEFEAKVRAQSFEDTDPIAKRESAGFIRTREPLNVQGFTGGASNRGLAAELIPFAEGEMPEVVPDKVYGVGPEGATAQTWAHEFRHKASPDMSERAVRIADAFLAGSPRQWNEAVRMWQDLNRFATPEEAEQSLVKMLRFDERFFARRNGGSWSLFRPDPAYAPYRNWTDE